MSRITAIEPQQKNPQRVNIYLDGEFAFGLARITAGWLKVGQELSEEKIAALQVEDANELAYQKALHFLSYRPRSSAEIRQNLTKRGTPEARVEETVNRLQRAGLVNDQDLPLPDWFFGDAVPEIPGSDDKRIHRGTCQSFVSRGYASHSSRSAGASTRVFPTRAAIMIVS